LVTVTVIRLAERKQKDKFVRIVSGAHRGRILVAPKGHSTRPTADRVRQALFDILEHAAWAPTLTGARVADLFAGSGALGLEALSRGAASCVFVDRDAGAREAIKANVAALGLADRCEILNADVRRLPKRPELDLAFLDPPYTDGLARPALEALLECGWLTASAIAVVEVGAREATPQAPGYTLLDERIWGAAKVAFYRVR
jgi:16S rRNA (guanine966-N2)-methyltransferase